MAVNLLDDGVDTTTNPSTTASISPTSGATVYAFVGVAETSGASFTVGGTLEITGAGLTWTTITKAAFATGRRVLFLMRGTGTPSAGALTITYTDDTGAAGVWTETMWSVFEVTDATVADPDDAPVSANTGGGGNTTLALGDVGTPDADDLIICGFIIEGATVSATLGQGTQITNLGGGSDVRTLVVGYDPTPFDETPSVSWTGTESAIGIGMIVNVTPVGGSTTRRYSLSLSGVG